MKPVQQTQVDKGNGNCWAACLASILELPIEEVPDFKQQKDFYGDTVRWLNEQNLTLVQVQLAGPHWPFFFNGQVYTILSGHSPRGDWMHSVVGDGLNPFYDPHPYGGFLKGDPEYLYLIMPLIEADNAKDYDTNERASREREEYSDSEPLSEAPKRRGRKPGSKNKPKD
jgi:hypothetical protein